MKKILLLFICCFLAGPQLFAQFYVTLGNFSKEEINLKECSFDKDAPAVVLLHEAYSTYDSEHRLITTHHVKIKILSEKGFSAANVSIPYYRKDEFEQIYKIEAISFNANAAGEMVKTNVSQRSMYTQKVNDRIGEVVFTFPAVKAGSILEYKYESSMKHYGGLEEWVFQERLPVLQSSYTLVVLPNTEFAYRVTKSLVLPIIITRKKEIGAVYFEMNNIPGLPDEPFMDSRKDYLQKVIFQLSGFYRGNIFKNSYMTSWDEMAKELTLSSTFGGQLDKNIAGTGDFIKTVKAIPGAEERMTAVYEFVRNNVKWNNLYTNFGFEGVKTAWQKKSGASGDINLLLVNLLQAASLDAYPMLVSERFNGRVDKDYPFLDQFNSVFACVIINDKKYYLDATDILTPSYLTPSGILNTTALLVNRKTGSLINISNDTAGYREEINAQLDVSKEGILSGDISIKSSGYARVKKMEEYINTKNKNEDSHLLADGADFTVASREFKNLEQDSLPLEQECKISGALNVSGEFCFLPLNFFTGFDTNPFVSENRFSNINFGYKRNIIANTVVQLPANYTVDEVPKLVQLTNVEKDIIFSRTIKYNKQSNSVTSTVVMEFQKSLYTSDVYPDIKEVYQLMAQFLKEPVLIKKKL